MLAADALVEDEGEYKPDFSAHSGSDHLRCIRISKATFDGVVCSSTDSNGEVSEGTACLEATPKGVHKEVQARISPGKPRKSVPATEASLRIIQAVSGSSASLGQNSTDSPLEAGMEREEGKSTSPPGFEQDAHEGVLDRRVDSVPGIRILFAASET